METNNNSRQQSAHSDVYQMVTDRIIKTMEQGRIPWVKPWNNGHTPTTFEPYIFDCRKYRDGKRYSLLNQMLLGEDGIYLSYKEAQEAGGHVKKGAKSRIVVFWKWLEKDKIDEDGNIVLDADGNPVKVKIPYLKYSNVFHINDCEGVKPRKHKEPKPEIKPNQNIVRVEAEAEKIADSIIEKYSIERGVTISIRYSNEAYYAPLADMIVIPLKSQYTEQAEFYSTAFHEMTHSTGHSSRLNRIKTESIAARGEDYSKEELVAEIGAAMLVSYCGINSEKAFKNSVGYLQGWLSKLRNDKRLIVLAAGAAEKAVRYILNETPDVEEDAD